MQDRDIIKKISSHETQIALILQWMEETKEVMKDIKKAINDMAKYVAKQDTQTERQNNIVGQQASMNERLNRRELERVIEKKDREEMQDDILTIKQETAKIKEIIGILEFLNKHPWFWKIIIALLYLFTIPEIRNIVLDHTNIIY